MTIRSSKGFSLIELLVVVAIIGILAAVGTVTYNGYSQSAMKSATEAAMQQIALQEQEYESINGSYFIQASCSPSDENVEEINTDLFETTADEPVVDLDGWRVCVDTHTTGFVVKACEWDATLSSCKAGEEVLTLNTKGARNF